MNPIKPHLLAADYYIQYLIETKDFGIRYGLDDTSFDYSAYSFLIATNASFSNDFKTCRSYKGFVYKLFISVVD